MRFDRDTVSPRLGCLCECVLDFFGKDSEQTTQIGNGFGWRKAIVRKPFPFPQCKRTVDDDDDDDDGQDYCAAGEVREMALS